MQFSLPAKSQQMRRCLGILLGLMVMAGLVRASEDGSSDAGGQCKKPYPNQIRVVTREELAAKTGVDGGPIWISIVGEVYDVSEGTEYYTPGKSYAAFPGRDASVPYVTGKFTAEEAEKSTDELKLSDLPGLVEWREFYSTHDVYKFVGRLVDPRYYDENGNPTEAMMRLQVRYQEAMMEREIQAQRRREERLKKQQAKAAAKQ